MTKLLKKYRSLSAQAEDIDTTESYKELIETIKNMTYGEMYQLFYDAETAMKVILREGLPSSHRGVLSQINDISKDMNLFLALDEAKYKKIRYTYEFSENPISKGKPIMIVDIGELEVK